VTQNRVLGTLGLCVLLVLLLLAPSYVAAQIEFGSGGGANLLSSGSDGDSSTTQSDSGLELIDGFLSILRGCADNDILKWDETEDDWNCEADSTGAGSLGANLSSTDHDILSDDGVVELGGTGDTNNENVLFDFETTADEVGVSSGTSVGNINFGGIALESSGGFTGDITGNAVTLTITDNEAEVETNGIVFTSGGTLTGSLGLESDGDLTYTPSTGTLEAPVMTEGGSAVLSAGDQNAGTDVTADLEEEAQIGSTDITGNAVAGATLLGTGANAAAWDASPAINCADCTNVNASSITDGLIIEPDLDADNAPSDGDILTYDITGTNFVWITPNAGTAVTADLEEEAQLGSTDATGNASAGAVLFGTGANAASWDTTPAIDCTDCTNIPAASNLTDIGDVTLTTPGDGAVLCFTGTGDASVDCTVGGVLSATEDSGTLTVAIVDGSIIEPDLDADNAASDGDILTYDSTGTNFAWITPNAGTDITADLEEEVTTGSLADGVINEPDLDVDNAASDGDILTYDSTGTNFAWITPNAGTAVTADLEEEAQIAATDVTGNASATAVLFGTGANAASWDTTPAIDCTDCTNIPTGSSHTGTVTWGGTAILESGTAFQFGDGTDATLTHTYANTGTNVSIAYSTGAMAVTGALSATNLSGTNTGDNDEVGTLTTGDLCVNDGSSVNCTVNTEAELETALDSLDVVTVTAGDITKANLETALSDVSDLAEADGDVFTGTHDFGGASLEIPNTNSGDATLTTEGQIHFKSDEDLIAMHGGAAGEAQGEFAFSVLQHLVLVVDPAAYYDQESTYRVLPIMTVGDDFPHGFTLTEWLVDYVGGDPTTELDADIMCDTTPDYNPAAGATVMDVINTTAGTATADTGFDSATCANASKMYIRFGSDPADANVIITVELWGYAEED
jgi:hypothetical protein